MADGKLRREVGLTTHFRVLALGFSAGILLAGRASAVGATTPHPPDPPVPFSGVSLKILNSQAPPGGVIQLTVTLTEPTPVMFGMTSLAFDAGALGPVLGVALFGSAGAQSDVVGAAVIRNNQLTVRTASPSAQFGMAIGAPILTVAIAVSPDAPLGSNGRLTIDPANSWWLDPSGQAYAQQVKNGRFEIAGTLSVNDVEPALGLLPAGSQVTVRGIGFQPGAIVELDGVPVASTTFVSDTELVATIGAAAELYGHRATVRNPDLARASYYAYPRTAWLAPSARPLLAATDPIFSPRTFSSASFASSAPAGQFVGLALQNPTTGPADVTVELRSEEGVIASTSLALPPSTRIARAVSELFGGIAAPRDGTLAVSSSVPVQMLGLIGDDAAGSVAPLIPASASP
jgi:hypothetical protein